MENRGAWLFAVLGFGLVAALMVWMAQSLDTKAPIRIRSGPSAAAEPAPTASPEEEAARETALMRALVARRAPALAAQAAAQAFSGEESLRALCTFTEAHLVHRDGPSAFWSAGFSCVDPGAPGSFPNLTSVSVRLAKDGERWVVSP